VCYRGCSLTTPVGYARLPLSAFARTTIGYYLTRGAMLLSRYGEIRYVSGGLPFP
jgi:hypothetical protein